MQRITLDDIREFFADHLSAQRSDPERGGEHRFPAAAGSGGGVVCRRGSRLPIPSQDEVPGDGSPWHIPHESNQTHITISYESVPYAHPDYYQARAAVGVLSDGMSSRLFTEVREKRGLCYAVYAVCHTLRDRGSVFCYAGTTTERAQETLDVMIHELRELSQGVRPDELQRLKARLRAR